MANFHCAPCEESLIDTRSASLFDIMVTVGSLELYLAHLINSPVFLTQLSLITSSNSSEVHVLEDSPILGDWHNPSICHCLIYLQWGCNMQGPIWTNFGCNIEFIRCLLGCTLESTSYGSTERMFVWRDVSNKSDAIFKHYNLSNVIMVNNTKLFCFIYFLRDHQKL